MRRMKPDRPVILLAGALDPQREALLDARSTLRRTDATDEPTLCALVVEVDALIVRTHVPVTRAVLAAGKRLRCVGVAGVGTDKVDTAAAAELNIPVLNTPEANADAAAEFTLALMLQLLRPIPRLQQALRDGQFWEARAEPHGRELRSLTVGIVGMGRIGSRVGRMCAAGFGARVLYNDIIPVGPFAYPAEPVDKPRLWREADIVTLHVPLTPDTRGLMNAETLAQLKPGALLINACRGPVVEPEALLSALESGHLAAAALDVTDPEPLPADHPLLRHPRCVVTPHVAARTEEGLGNMYAIAEKVLEFLAGHEQTD